MSISPVPRLHLVDALTKGSPADVQSFSGRLDWEELSIDGGVPSIARHAAEFAFQTRAKGEGEAGIFELLSMAAREGRQEAFGLFLDGTFSDFPQPALDFIRLGYERVMALYVANGLDPHATPMGSALTALEVADLFQRPGVALAMRAAAARKQVSDILDATEVGPIGPSGTPQ